MSALKNQSVSERLRRLSESPIEYVASAEFDAPGAEAVILGPAPPSSGRKGLLRAPAGIPPYLASLYEIPLLSASEEVYYFRRMNYLKHLAARRLAGIDRARATDAEVADVERLLHEAGEIKNRLVRANLRLVISVARRYARAGANFFELVSDGNVSLMRAIEKFDYGRGFKFSTYATWAVKKNFYRTIPAEFTQQSRFRTGQDEAFEAQRDRRTSQFAQELMHDRQSSAVETLLDRLDERDRTIVALRFGLAADGEPLTLDQVGARLGVTKERVRQLEKRALGRLRDIAAGEKLEIPGI